jgi:osmotically inducible protein OsmC
VRARIPGTDEATFLRIARMAEQGCPVSKVLKASISMDAQLVA